MKVLYRDSQSKRIGIEFTQDEFNQVSLGLNCFYDSYRHNSPDSDGKIINTFEALFRNRQRAASMALRDYNPTAILKDCIGKLHKWMEDSQELLTAGLEKDEEKP